MSVSQHFAQGEKLYCFYDMASSPCSYDFLIFSTRLKYAGLEEPHKTGGGFSTRSEK